MGGAAEMYVRYIYARLNIFFSDGRVREGGMRTIDISANLYVL
jgi:hypothetical protein